MSIPGRVKRRGPIDWSAIRGRMDALSGHPAGTVAVEQEQVESLLFERARALARPAAVEIAGERLDVVSFMLANETFAIECRYVIAVFRLAELAPLPGAGPPVSGLTAWRGQLLTILDLRTVLNLSAAGVNEPRHVLVVGTDRDAVGVLADAALERLSLPAGSVRPLAEGERTDRTLVRGMTSGAVQLLDGERLPGLIEPDPI